MEQCAFLGHLNSAHLPIFEKEVWRKQEFAPGNFVYFIMSAQVLDLVREAGQLLDKGLPNIFF